MSRLLLILSIALGTTLTTPATFGADGWAPETEAAFARLRARLLRPPNGFARSVLAGALRGESAEPEELERFFQAAGPLVFKLDVRAYPERFSAAHANFDRDLQLVVDSVFSRLFAGPMGRQLCLEAGNSATRLQAYFGLSPETAKSWETPCSGGPEWADRLERRDARQPSWRSVRRSYSVIVAAPGITPAVDGWSVESNPLAASVFPSGLFPTGHALLSRPDLSPLGDSAIAFFRAQDVSLNALAYRLLHEAAIFFDQKATIPSRRLTGSPSAWATVQGHPCSLASALGHPTVSLATAAVRAMRLEIAWLREMRLPPPASTAPPGRRARDFACPDQLAAISARLEQVVPDFAIDRGFYSGEIGRIIGVDGGRSLCAAEHLATLTDPSATFAPLSISDAVSRLAAEPVKTSDGRTLSACEFALEPAIGVHDAIFVRRGPRPGFGGGW